MTLCYEGSERLYNITIGSWSEPYQTKNLVWMPVGFLEIRKGEIFGMSFYLPKKYHNELNYLNVTYTYIENNKPITESQQMWFDIPS